MRCYPTWCDNIDNTDWEAQEAKRVIKNDKQVLHGVMNERSLLAAEWMLTVLHSYPCFFIQDQQKLQFSSCKNLARHSWSSDLTIRSSNTVSMPQFRYGSCVPLHFAFRCCDSQKWPAFLERSRKTLEVPCAQLAHLSGHSLSCLSLILSSPAFKRWQLPTCKQHQSTPPLHI